MKRLFPGFMLIALLLVLALPAVAEDNDRVAVSPTVWMLKAWAEDPPVFVRPGIVNSEGFLGSARFSEELTEDEIGLLEAVGLKFYRSKGVRPDSIGAIYPVVVPWEGLDELLQFEKLMQLEPETIIKPISPLNVTRALTGAPELSDHIGAAIGEKPGEGIRIADLDSGIDVFHPAFFHPDGGYYSWIDVDGDGLLTLGTDACDLNRDGVAGPDEVLRFHDVSLLNFEPEYLDSWDIFDPDGAFEAWVDWLYVDTNGNGVRDFGPENGFNEGDPAFGEPVLLIDDVNRNGKLDLIERLARLKTSKIAKVLVAGEEYIRGVNLSQLDPSIFPGEGFMPGSSHGTGVAGILAANTPGLSKFVGLAPYAELYMVDHSLDHGGQYGFISGSLNQMIWSRDQNVDIMLYEFSSWGMEFIDGSSNMEKAMDELHQNNNIVQVSPAGNLAGSGKHMLAEFSQGTINVGVDLPSKWPDTLFQYFDTPGLILAFYWYGEEEDFHISVTEPEGEKKTGIPSTSYNPTPLGENMVVYSFTEKSTSGLMHRIVSIYDKNQTKIPDGEYKLQILNQAGKNIALHGYIQDLASGWARMTVFTTYESDDTTICHPSTADSAFSVAAYGGEFGPPEELGMIRGYSGRGPRIDGKIAIDIAAPDDPYTPFPELHTGPFSGNKDVVASYMVFGGTSGAGPHVAAGLALVKQLEPSAAADNLVQMMVQGTATEPHMGQLPNKEWGYGKLDVYKAIFGQSAPANAPPVASVELYNVDGYEVIYDGTGSTDPEGMDLEYRWDLDYDGVWDTNWGSVPSIAHPYPENSGPVTAKLAVRDDLGAEVHTLLSVDLPNDYEAPPEDLGGQADAISAADTGGETPAPADEGKTVGKKGGGGCNTSTANAPSCLALLMMMMVLTSVVLRRRGC